MVGLLVGLVLGALAFIPPARRWVSLPALIYGVVGALSLLVITGGGLRGGHVSPMVMFYLLQLAALGALFAGAIGFRSGAQWAGPVLFGAAGGWLLGNCMYVFVVLNPRLLMTSTGLTYAALVWGVPVLAVCVALWARGEREAARVHGGG